MSCSTSVKGRSALSIIQIIISSASIFVHFPFTILHISIYIQVLKVTGPWAVGWVRFPTAKLSRYGLMILKRFLRRKTVTCPCPLIMTTPPTTTTNPPSAPNQSAMDSVAAGREEDKDDEEIATSYFGATYRIGISGRQPKQKLWTNPATRKTVFKSKATELPPFPSTHIPSQTELSQQRSAAQSLPPTRYLWIGMSGQWANRYSSAKKSKGKGTIDTVEDSLRVVPITIMSQLKAYALMGTGELKTPCTLSNDLIFYFSEVSTELEEGPVNNKRDSKSLWNKTILEYTAKLARDTQNTITSPANQTASTKATDLQCRRITNFL